MTIFPQEMESGRYCTHFENITQNTDVAFIS